MASGDPVVQVESICPPAANYATLDIAQGGSTPAEIVRVWDFDASAIEYLDLRCRLHAYDSGGLTLYLHWSATSATTGAVVWEAAIRRIADDAEDFDSSHSYSFNSVTATTASAAGELDYAEITFTDGADMDSWATGEVAIIRIRRNATSGSDTMTGDAELWMVTGEES